MAYFRAQIETILNYRFVVLQGMGGFPTYFECIYVYNYFGIKRMYGGLEGMRFGGRLLYIIVMEDGDWK